MMARIGRMAGLGAAAQGSTPRRRCAPVLTPLFLGLAFWAAGSVVAAADWLMPTPRTGRADIAGRWVLRAPSNISCVVDFSGSPETFSGSITATGFCPRPFLGRPQWRYEDGHVVITGRRGTVMADLTVSGRNLLAGRIATGEDIWLNR